MTDRFYTSVVLVLELLANRVYTVGTVMTKLGFPKNVTDKQKSRPAGVTRGESTVAASKAVPSMAVVSWMNSKPVHFLATSANREPTTVGTYFHSLCLF